MFLLPKKILLIFFSLLVLLPVKKTTAQVKFTATVSPASIGVDETTTLNLVVENATQVEQISPPALKDFIIVGGPNQESRIESNNGNSIQSYGISYIIKPRSIGNFIIGPASAKADGAIFQSKPIKVQVSSQPSGNNQNSTSISPLSGLPGFDRPAGNASFKDNILKKGENIQEKIAKNIFIRSTVDKTSCYVGEPVVVAYKLYTRLKSESNIVKNPSFNGFSVIDLIGPGNMISGIEKINGKDYNVYTLRQSQLYPLQAGEMELEIAEVDNNIQFIKEEYANREADMFSDIFDGFTRSSIPPEGIVQQQVTLQSKPMTITVKPLPEDGKPASFRGAVGQFSIRAELEKNKLTTDEAGKLTITITGEGNMTLINAPEILWPAGIEGFDPKVKEDFTKVLVPVKGSKHFEYPFAVQKTGNYTIPSIEFSYFDIKKGSYTTVSSNALVLIVKKGNGKAPPGVNTIPFNNESFFDNPSNYRWWIIGTLATLIFIGLLAWGRRESRKKPVTFATLVDEQKPDERHHEIPKNPLAESVEKLARQDIHGFYSSLKKELKIFLSRKFNIPAGEVNKKNMEEAFEKKGVAIPTSLQLQQLLDEIEWQLYTPFADTNKMQEHYETAATLVHTLSRS